MPITMVRSFYVLLFCLAAPGIAAAEDPLPGPIPAEVVRVIDGDTVAVRARIWPGHEVRVSVRLAGVDAPELRGPDCEAERAGAVAARDFVAALVGEEVSLFDVDTGTYAGRVIARIVTHEGLDVSQSLMQAGYAVRYGEADWC